MGSLNLFRPEIKRSLSGYFLTCGMVTTNSPLDSDPMFGRILLIEDEAPHALLVERALKGLAGEVIKASSWSEAREKLSELVRAAGESADAVTGADLIISDLHIPGAPSGGPVSTIKELAQGVPLIVLTASSSVKDGVDAMRLGAADFLVKNFDATFKDVLHLSLNRIAVAQAAEAERIRIARDRDTLQRAVENSDDGFALVDEQGAVVYSNSAFRKFLKEANASDSNVLSLEPAGIVNGASVIEALRQKLNTISEGGVWTSECVGAGERAFAYDLSLSGVPTGEPGCVARAMWLRDSRERKQREKFQREILSTTTHDLKGPLGAISISCEVLLDKEMEDRRTRQVLERISSSANTAIQLIEEFLSVRRIEEGTFVLRPIAQPLLPIVERCVDTFTIPYGTRGISLSVVCEDQLASAVVDALAVERVVSNLLSNGMKFTPKGGSVVVTVARNGGGATISVADTGAGMEPSEAQALFQRFSRLDKHAGVAGSGLGLFIVKSVVSAHGGGVEVSSAPGKGTTFDLFFPDAPPINTRGEVMCLNF